MRRLLLAGALLWPFAAHADFVFCDNICENTTTTGTGDVSLAGALTNYLAFSTCAANGDEGPYNIRASNGQVETGSFTFTDGTPDTLARDLKSSSTGSLLDLPAGTHRVCLGFTSAMFQDSIADFSFNELNANDGTFATLSVADLLPILTVRGTDPGAVGPQIQCHHDSASPVDGDIACDFRVLGATDDELLGRLAVEVDDGDTLPGSHWRIFTKFGGSNIESAVIDTVGSGSNGQIRVGVTPATDLSVDSASASLLVATNNSPWAAIFSNHSATNGGASNVFAKSRNATVGSHTVLSDNDDIAAILGYGSDGDQYINAGGIRMRVDGAPSNNVMPTEVVIATNSGGASVTERVRVSPAGHFEPITDNVTDLANATIGFRDLYLTRNLEMGGDTANSINCTGGNCTIEGNGFYRAGGTDVAIADGGTGAGDAATAFGNLKQNASETATGVVEMATTAEAEAGTDTSRAVTAAGMLAAASGLQTLSIPAGAWVGETTTGCAPGLAELANGIMQASFDCDFGTQEGVQTTISRMPKSWNEGTITAQVSWTTAGTGNVLWLVSCAAISNDDVMNASFGSEISVTDAVTAANDLMIADVTAAITCSGSPAEGDLLQIRVQRDADNASDTVNANDARFLGANIYYTVNAFTDD